MGLSKAQDLVQMVKEATCTLKKRLRNTKHCKTGILESDLEKLGNICGNQRNRDATVLGSTPILHAETWMDERMGSGVRME